MFTHSLAGRARGGGGLTPAATAAVTTAVAISCMLQPQGDIGVGSGSQPSIARQMAGCQNGNEQPCSGFAGDGVEGDARCLVPVFSLLKESCLHEAIVVEELAEL